jgi:signal transduction histidine kinase
LDATDEVGFPEGGIAGAVFRAVDWSTNPLGPVGLWPISLKTIVRALLSTRQATCLFWGPELINLYNDGFIPLLGEKHPHAMGQRAQDCWNDAWPVVGKLLADVVGRGSAVLFQEMLIPIVRSGRLQDAWWNYSYSPVFDDGGTIAGVLVVATETTAEVAGRKQLEAAKLEAELARQELHAIFMQAPLPMALLKGPEHRFCLVNAPYRALVNRDVMDQTLREAFNQEEVGYYIPILDRVYQTGEPVTLQEAPLRLPDGAGVLQDRFIDVGYYPYLDAAGTVAGVHAVIHDVTDDVLARVRESDLRKAAEAANRAKDEFLATVSHELRNPLSAILGWSRLLVDNRDPARLAKGLDVIARNAKGQARLIDDILDVSRITSGKLVLDRRRVQLTGAIENAIESIRPTASAKGIRIVQALGEAGIEVIVDEDRLSQVVWNLLSNAVKFTDAGGEVRITATQASSRVAIRVEDTGRGIAADLLPHVFDRFRQGDGSTTKSYAGLGLGLAIVRHLVELHGGSVSAQSEGADRGATFEVILPIPAVGPPERTPVPSASESPRVPEAGARPLAGVHVLVVDDEADARDLVTVVLQESGAIVRAASSADEAMQLLASSPIEVMVSDIGMPMRDGYSLMEWLRSQGPATTRDVPALALSAYARAEDRQRAASAGFQSHAAKPIDPLVLVRLVTALVPRRAT